MPKKLVIAAEIFPPDIGGPATYSQTIAEELFRQGWKVKLICYSDKIENDPYSFPVVRVLRSNPLKHYFNYFWHLTRLAKDSDVIYAQGPVSSGLSAVIAGFFLSKKVIVKVVGDYAWEQARNSNQTEIGIDEFQKQDLTGKIGWLRKIEKWVCQKSAKVIVPSQYLRDVVKGWGVDEKKIEVIYNAFEKINIERKKEVDNNLIVSVGRLVPWKGFDTLIELMPELLKENPNFRLKIFGSGHEEENLKSLIIKYNLKDKVSIEHLNHNDLLKELSDAGIFVLNSGYEGLSHSILEAMGAGVPVIASRVGGNPELINDAETGLLFKYNDKEQLKEAILELYQDPSLRQKFEENPKTVLQRFTFEEMINKTIKVLETACPVVKI